MKAMRSALRSFTALLKRLDRIQDRLQSLRLHTTDGQRSPEQRAEAVIILDAYKASSVEIVHAMLGEVAVCDDPGIKYTFQHYIDYNSQKLAMMGDSYWYVTLETNPFIPINRE